MALSEIEKGIIEDFNLFDDPMDKYEHIIEEGNDLEPLDEKDRIDDNLVKGCTSKVWLVAFADNGKIYFKADSNTVITKGVVSLLVKVLSGNTSEFILNNELQFLKEIGIQELLSSQRANGLQSMIILMRKYAKDLA